MAKSWKESIGKKVSLSKLQEIYKQCLAEADGNNQKAMKLYNERTKDYQDAAEEYVKLVKWAKNSLILFK